MRASTISNTRFRRFCRSGVAEPRSRSLWNGTPFMPLVDEQSRGWQPVGRTKIESASVAGIFK
jgi:hypothetical protein